MRTCFFFLFLCCTLCSSGGGAGGGVGRATPLGIHIRRGDKIKTGVAHKPGILHDETDVTEAAAVYDLALQSLRFLLQEQQGKQRLARARQREQQQQQQGQGGDQATGDDEAEANNDSSSSLSSSSSSSSHQQLGLSVYVVSDDARWQKNFEDAALAMGVRVVERSEGNASGFVAGGATSHVPSALADFFGLTLCREVWMVSSFSSFAVMAAAVAGVPVRSLYSPTSTHLFRYGVDARPFPNATWPWRSRRRVAAEAEQEGKNEEAEAGWLAAGT
jgi:hypothetical protein